MRVLRLFLAGIESRHWIPLQMVSDEVISCGRMAVEKWGGYDESVKNTARTFWNHSFMLMLIRKGFSRISEIFCLIPERLHFAEQAGSR